MEWSKPNRAGDAAITPVERVSFDVIRTLAAVRQQASPTVKAMRNAMTAKRESAPMGHPSTRIEVFSGHQRPGSDPLTGGGFLAMPERDAPCPDQDKNNA